VNWRDVLLKPTPSPPAPPVASEPPVQPTAEGQAAPKPDDDPLDPEMEALRIRLRRGWGR
jgi:hypothetical protein